MEASQRPRMLTASTCTAETEQGTHSFKIVGYSSLKGIGRGKVFKSADFSVGGYNWCIRFYPDGNSEKHSPDNNMSVYLQLRSKNASVRALYDFKLVNKDTGLLLSIFSRGKVQVFRSSVLDNPTSVTGMSMKRSVLEASSYLSDDCFMIKCDITVIKESRVVDTAISSVFEVEVLPSDLLDNVGKFFESKEVTDVTFQVKGEIFHAHKIILAMRSSVFKAELYGLMRHKEMNSIMVEDMEPFAFKALLEFIYTDSLPTMDDFDSDENVKIVMHFLVAADRYALEMMKLTCENILCKKLDFDNVDTTLALADQHYCSKLKDACIGFSLTRWVEWIV